SDKASAFARLNKPAGSLDAALAPPNDATASNVDVFQSGAAVLAWDKSQQLLYPVDVNLSKAVDGQKVAIPDTDQVALAGGTLAVFDPSTGKVWAQRVDPSVS